MSSYYFTSSVLVLVLKETIVQVDATPFRQWFNQHYGVELGKKADGEKKSSAALTRKREARKKTGGQIDQGVADQMKTGRLIACISSRPGQRLALFLSLSLFLTLTLSMSLCPFSPSLTSLFLSLNLSLYLYPSLLSVSLVFLFASCVLLFSSSRPLSLHPPVSPALSPAFSPHLGCLFVNECLSI